MWRSCNIDRSATLQACTTPIDSLGKLQTNLKAGRFVITAELQPPLSCDRAALLQQALPLRDLADAINITDGAGARAHLSALASATILAQHGIEPVLQITCRDRNRIALQSDLLGAAALGIGNLLILRGDDPSAGDQPDAAAVFDLDSRALLATARTIRDRGTLPGGQKISGRANFFLGAADTPVDPPANWHPQALTDKIAAGAQFVQTQFCMDMSVLSRYLRRLADYGITEQLYVLVGIAPLRSARSARWMRHHLVGTIIPDNLLARLEGAANPNEEGHRICFELLEALVAMPGVAGAHVMAPGNETAIPEILLEAARIRTQRHPMRAAAPEG
jgi:methylenetetrahydrofolate reductase (NADPH)